MSPAELVYTAMVVEFRDKPIAKAHLNWYLGKGKGRDFEENDNIKSMLLWDEGVRRAIALRLGHGPRRGTSAGYFKLGQGDYANQDFRFAFGAIDRLDFEADYDRGTVHVWFQDRYEWHPCYPELYSTFPDDVPRQTNCVHAAMVELKAFGAADFWMKGEATVPLHLLTMSDPPLKTVPL